MTGMIKMMMIMTVMMEHNSLVFIEIMIKTFLQTK